MDDVPRTDKYRLVEHLIGGDLDGFVRARRVVGKAWRRIEKDIAEASDGKADVTGQTLYEWFPEYREPALIERSA